jgi:hypothetical protein
LVRVPNAPTGTARTRIGVIDLVAKVGPDLGHQAPNAMMRANGNARNAVGPRGMLRPAMEMDHVVQMDIRPGALIVVPMNWM